MDYHFSTSSSASFPYSVTKASDMLAAISNRNDTPCVIGEHRFGKDAPGFFIPVSHNAMASILGPELAHKFMNVRNEAVKAYFGKVVERLQSIGIHIAYSPSCWFIAKLPKSDSEIVAASSLYTTADLLSQRPNGLPAGDVNDVVPE